MTTEAGERLLEMATYTEGPGIDSLREYIAAIEAEAIAAERERITGYEARLVRVSDELLSAFSTRDADGNLLTLEWGEPDADGIYEPVITRHTDDNIVAAERERIAQAVEGLPDDCHSEEGSCYCGSALNPDTPVSRAAVLAIVRGDSHV